MKEEYDLKDYTQEEYCEIIAETCSLISYKSNPLTGEINSYPRTLLDDDEYQEILDREYGKISTDDEESKEAIEDDEDSEKDEELNETIEDDKDSEKDEEPQKASEQNDKSDDKIKKIVEKCYDELDNYDECYINYTGISDEKIMNNCKVYRSEKCQNYFKDPIKYVPSCSEAIGYRSISA